MSMSDTSDRNYRNSITFVFVECEKISHQKNNKLLLSILSASKTLYQIKSNNVSMLYYQNTFRCTQSPTNDGSIRY